MTYYLTKLLPLIAVSVLCSQVVMGQDVTVSTPTVADCKIDLAILVDTSGSIVDDRHGELGDESKRQEILRNWYAVTNFTSSIIRAISVSEDETHVALVTFSSVVNTRFALSAYNQSDMLANVRDLAREVPNGETNAFGALTKARDEIFAIGGPGNRPDVVDVIIMITDGAPTPSYGDDDKILQETDSLKSRGFTIFAVGVGEKVNATLLQMMVNSPNSSHYFPVDNFQGLELQLESIINQTCQVREIETISVGCVLDLAFVLDSSGSLQSNASGLRNWDQVIDFTIRVTRSYTWNVTDDKKPRISAITFSTQAELAFDLKTYNTMDDYVRALSNVRYLGGNTNTAAALRMSSELIFTPAGGDRAGVQNVLVLITDGLANLEQENLTAAVEELKFLGVHIIVVFIGGRETSSLDSINFASVPENDFFKINEFNQLSSIYQNVSEQTCEDFVSGCTVPVDVYLVLDASGSIGEENFQALKDFTTFFISDIAAKVLNSSEVRIGVLLFSDGVQPIFSLNTYTNASDMRAAVKSIRYIRGTTNTAAAIRYLRESGFTASAGDRDWAPNVAVILTDGNSDNKRSTLNEAYLTKMAGVHLITVGIGGWTNKYELQGIPSYPHEQNYRPIRSFSGLDNLLRYQLKNIVCNADDPCASSPCQCGGTCIGYIGGYICQCPPECAGINCETVCKDPKDLVLALDASGSVGEDNFRKQLDFVQQMVLMLNFNQNTRLALMGYSDEAYVQFHLKDHLTKLEILNAMSLYYAGGATNMHLALRKMYEEVFTVANGDRSDFDDVALLLTDGRPSNRAEAWREAMILRSRGIELLTLGIGGYFQVEELRDLASGPGLSHIYQTANFTTLLDTATEVVDAICNNVNECEPDYCKNGGTPVDLINRCECRCHSITSGPDCNRGCADRYDIILVLDASGSIRHERFREVLEFVVEVVSQFQVAGDMARFALVYFSDEAYTHFLLDSYFSLQDVIAAIRRTPYLGGRTNIADALDMTESISGSNGDRGDVLNHVVVITDGHSNVRERDTMKSAILLRSDTGAKITALGIGRDADSLELKGIASEPVSMMAFSVTSFNDVISNMAARSRLLDQIVTSTCDDTDECVTQPCQNGGTCTNDLHQYICDCPSGWTGRNCSRSCTASMDLTFILDFSGSMDDLFDIVIVFAREVTQGLPFQLGGLTRVAVVTYETGGEVQFYLDEYTTKLQVLNALVFSKVQGGTTNTQEALFMTYSDVFRASRGDRVGVDNIAVAVTDGKSNVNSGSTIPRATEAKEAGVEVFVAAFGETPNYSEVNGIASDPDSSHVIAVPDANSVTSAANVLLDRLCQ